MKKIFKLFAVVMSMVLLVTGVTFSPAPRVEAAAKTKLSAKKLTVQVGKTKTLKLKNNKKKTKWKIVSGKGKVQLKSKKKNSVKIVGKKKGTAKVQVKVGKKKYTCKITVKAKKSTGGSGGDTVNLPPKKTPEPNYPLPSIKPVIPRDEADEMANYIEVTYFILSQNSGVLMKVTNNNDTLIHCAKISYDLYSAGVPVSSGTGEAYEIPAGETRYVYDPIYASSDVAIDEGYAQITVDQSYEYTDVSGYLQGTPTEDREHGKITVSIKNTYKSTIDKVPVLIIFYDGGGNIVDVVKNDVPGGISAGDTQILELNRTAVGTDDSGRYIYSDYDHFEVIIEAYKY